MRDDAGVNDHLYLLVASIGQIRQSPHRVDQDLQEMKNSLLFYLACTNQDIYTSTFHSAAHQN